MVLVAGTSWMKEGSIEHILTSGDVPLLPLYCKQWGGGGYLRLILFRRLG